MNHNKIIMPFRAIIYSLDHTPNYIYLNDSVGNWFNFNHSSYRRDRKAVAQVITKGKQIKNLVESFYVEGNPIPLFSKLKIEVVTEEHWDQKFAIAGNKPQASGFWARLMGN
jgi:hypothetical protein